MFKTHVQSVVGILLGCLIAANQSYADPQLSRHKLTVEEYLSTLSANSAPLSVEIIPLQPSALAGEVFFIRLVITNSYSYSILLEVRNNDHLPLFASQGSAALVLFAQDPVGSSIAQEVIAVEPMQTAQLTIPIQSTMDPVAKTLYSDTPYELTLQLAGQIRGYAMNSAEGDDAVWRIVSKPISIEIHAPEGREQDAYTVLNSIEDTVVTPEEKIVAYRKFLAEFEDSRFAAWIRVLLLDLLRDRVGDDNKRNVGGGADADCQSLYLETIESLAKSSVALSAFVDRHLLENISLAGRWDMFTAIVERLAQSQSNERTSDPVLARVIGEWADTERMKSKGYINNDVQKDMVERALIIVAKHCATWDGYRSISFEKRTLELLDSKGEWELLEIAASKTIQVAQWPTTIRDRLIPHYDPTDAVVARGFLQRAQSMKH